MQMRGNAFFRFLYFRLLGWKAVITVPHYRKCVICAAPHTSNWDLVIGELFYCALGKKASFLMKREWFFFPLGYLFRAIGGIPVDRKRKTSLVEQMAQRFAESRDFHLAITPEGTRKPNREWKRGFYYIAQKAQVPIVLIGIDYPSRTITATRTFTPSDDVERDMNEIKQYFSNFRGKNPENFVL